MFLNEITGKNRIENSHFECKALLNRQDTIGWLKTIAGFANAKGGEFYIGVEDKTSKLIGFNAKEADNERNYFNNCVNEHLIPRPSMKIDFLNYTVNGNERYIIKITVLESSIKPVVLKHKGIPEIYMRREGFTNGATYEEIIEMSIKSQHIQYDAQISDIKYEKNNFKELREFYFDHTGKKLSEKFLKSIGFYNEEGFLANGAVLFMDNYDGNKTSVQCSLFKGLNKGSERIITINRYKGNIIRIIKYMTDFVKQRMNQSMIKLSDSRINIDAYPERALFEGIINSIAHRDYYIDGTDIQLDMFVDRLEISSPGGFYRHEPIDKTYELSNIISKRRNELISAILVACRVMEAAGTGFDKIVEEYAPYDDMHHPYIYSKSDHFTLVLPDLTYENGVVDSNIPIVEFPPVNNGSEYDDKILSYCYFTPRKVAEITKYLGISNSTYFRKQVLMNLLSNDYLTMKKEGNTSYYFTNRTYVRLK
ncbi:MAG: ATP-binding protein [Firmicutes bacterium]|nr:ATP-binding protein [Bacillota bacterium]